MVVFMLFGLVFVHGQVALLTARARRRGARSSAQHHTRPDQDQDQSFASYLAAPWNTVAGWLALACVAASSVTVRQTDSPSATSRPDADAVCRVYVRASGRRLISSRHRMSRRVSKIW